MRTLVHVDRRHDRVTLTLADPERLNPLSPGLNLQLQERLDEIARDPEIRSVVITGQDPASSAGGRPPDDARRERSHPRPYYLRGDHIDAAEALELGLVGEVHPHDELLAGASAWCERAAAVPAHALEMTKSLLRAAVDAPWEEALRLEEFAEANCFSSAALGHATKSLLRKSPAARDR